MESTEQFNLMLSLPNKYQITYKNQTPTTFEFVVRTKPEPQTCPYCHSQMCEVHGYKNHRVNDVLVERHLVIFNLQRRRHLCLNCKRTFSEECTFNDIVAPHYKRSKRQILLTLEELGENVTYKHIAKRYHVAISTIMHTIDEFPAQAALEIGEVLAIDEFSGDTDAGKYQVILVDPIKHAIIDIVPNRSIDTLSAYFKDIPYETRCKVKFFVSDLYRPYQNLAKIYFPYAKIISDKFHFIRIATDIIHHMAVVMYKDHKNDLTSEQRDFLQENIKILSMRASSFDVLSTKKRKRDRDREDLKNSELKEKLIKLLVIFNSKKDAYNLLQEYLEIGRIYQFNVLKARLAEWDNKAQKSGIPEFVHYAKTTLEHNYKSILNAFEYGYTNAVTEGLNGFIKSYKRVAYGYHNFQRSRKRILLLRGETLLSFVS